MLLHEHQSKELLEAHGIACPRGGVASTLTQARAISLVLKGRGFFVKSQVLAGERAAAGGVLRASTPDGVETATDMLLGKRLLTPQTGPEGLLVTKVLVEEELTLAHQAYVAVLVNPVTGRIELIGAPEAPKSGYTSRQQIDEAPARISFRHPIEPAPAELEAFARSLGFTAPTAAAHLIGKAITTFVAIDATLMEFSPLGETSDGRVCPIDVKINIDDNALFRQERLALAEDVDQIEGPVLKAHQHDVNYIELDGDIGLVVNGAGLGLATLDMVVEAGGRAANFMDIRTGASTRGLADGIKLVIANPAVRVLLINIHGGGLTKCDLIAEALGLAVRETGTRLPIVFRAAGNNADYARTVLGNCGITAELPGTMTEAARVAVRLAAGGR